MYACAQVSGDSCLQWVAWSESVWASVSPADLTLCCGFAAGLVILFAVLGGVYGTAVRLVKKTLS